MKYNVTTRIRKDKMQVIISYKLKDNWQQKAKSFPLISKNKCDETLKNDWIKSTVNKLGKLGDKEDTFKTLCDNFLNNIELYRSYKTCANYVTVINQLKDIWHLKVPDIYPKHIQDIIDELVKQGYKSSTVACYVTRIKSIFEYYIRFYDPNFKNPCTFLLMPRKEKNIYEVCNEVEEVLSWTKENFSYEEYLIVLVAIKTGMRKSEIFGLSIEDIENSFITVRKQLKKDKYGSLFLGSLKTSNSYRKIPISKSLENELKTFKEKGIIFTINPYTFSNGYCKKLKKKFGLTMLSFRHYYCTKLIENGLDFKTVSAILGHEVKQTMITYSHVNTNMYNNAKDIIDKLF